MELPKRGDPFDVPYFIALLFDALFYYMVFRTVGTASCDAGRQKLFLAPRLTVEDDHHTALGNQTSESLFF